MELDLEEARKYIVGKFVNLGDYDFLNAETLEKMIDTLLDMDVAYMDSLGEDGEYDEDAVFEDMQNRLKADFPAYKMYMMRFVDDYLDFMNEYLDSVGAIDWL